MNSRSSLSVEELHTVLASVQTEVAEFRRILARRKTGVRRRLYSWLGLSLAVTIFAGARIVIADSPSAAGEVIPRQIPYRGYLQQNGTPATGQYSMTFELYTDQTATSPLWSENRSVAVVNGAFGVDLGDCDPAANCPTGSLSTALPTNPPSLYLAVKIQGQALAGRQRLMSVPYAQRASWANTSVTANNAQRSVPGVQFIADSLQVAGPAAVTAGLTVGSSLTVSEDLSARDVTARNLTESGSLTVAGNAQVNGTIRGASYGFGGIYSVGDFASNNAMVNPLTGAQSCPAGFTAYAVARYRLAEPEVGGGLFVCIK